MLPACRDAARTNKAICHAAARPAALILRPLFLPRIGLYSELLDQIDEWCMYTRRDTGFQELFMELRNEGKRKKLALNYLRLVIVHRRGVYPNIHRLSIVAFFFEKKWVDLANFTWEISSASVGNRRNSKYFWSFWVNKRFWVVNLLVRLKFSGKLMEASRGKITNYWSIMKSLFVKNLSEFWFSECE